MGGFIGQSATFSGTFITTNVPSTDIATADGADVLTDIAVSDNDTAICRPDINPSIDITKGCVATLNTAGNAVNVHFTGKVKNVGDVEMANVTVVDDQGGAGTVTVLSPFTLGRRSRWQARSQSPCRAPASMT